MTGVGQIAAVHMNTQARAERRRLDVVHGQRVARKQQAKITSVDFQLVNSQRPNDSRPGIASRGRPGPGHSVLESRLRLEGRSRQVQN